MAFEADFVTHCKANAGIAGLIGGRLYPLRVPQDVNLPSAAYQVISAPRDHAHTGAGGLVHMRMQITCQAKDYGAAKGLSEAFRACLDGYKGTMGSTSVDSCLMVNESDAWGTSLSMPVKRIDFMIWYHE